MFLIPGSIALYDSIRGLVGERQKNYACRRDDFCAGQLMYVSCPRTGIYNDEVKSLDGLLHGICHIGRKVAFTIENQRFHDVLWNSPLYQISDIAKKIPYDSVNVRDYRNLKNVLTYLKYNEFLTESDIKKIYKTLLCNPDFVYDLILKIDGKSDIEKVGSETQFLIKGETPSFSGGLVRIKPNINSTVSSDTEEQGKEDKNKDLLQELYFLYALCQHNHSGRPFSCEPDGIKTKLKWGRVLFWGEVQ